MLDPGLLLQAHIKSNYGAQVNFVIPSGMTELAISQVIHGRRKLTPEQAQTWSRALNLSPDILKPFIRDEN